MSKTAIDYRDYYKVERIAGAIIAMAPSPGISHSRAGKGIRKIFERYLEGKPCEVFHDQVDVFLSEKDRLVPDLIVVCNPDIIKEDGVHGPPDLVVEILSRSTAKRDRIIKKELYGKIGVKEYWIVDIPNRAIEVYILADGRLEFDNIYEYMPQKWVEEELITQAIKDESISTFKTSIFDDLIIDLEEVFAEIEA